MVLGGESILQQILTGWDFQFQREIAPSTPWGFFFHIVFLSGSQAVSSLPRAFSGIHFSFKLLQYLLRQSFPFLFPLFFGSSLLFTLQPGYI